MVRFEDIARAAGVSIPKVSKALNGKPGVNREEALRIMAIAEELGYSGNRLARGVKTGKSRLWGCIINDIANPYNAELLGGISGVAAANDYAVLIGDTRHGKGAAVDHLLSYRVEGLLVATRPEDGTMASALSGFADSGHPVVFNQQVLSNPLFGYVAVDYGAAAEHLVCHLASLGHTDVCFAGSDGDELGNSPRLVGYVRGLAKNSLPYRPHLVLTGPDYPDTFEGGSRAAMAMFRMAPMPTAVMALNDEMAMGIVDALEARDVSVPRHVSVTGFDDIAVYRRVKPRLTTISTDNHAWGASMANALLSMLVGNPPCREYLGWSFVPGGTTSAIQGTRQDNVVDERGAV